MGQQGWFFSFSDTREVYGTDGMVWTGFIDDAYDMMWIEPSFATPEQQRFAAQWSRLRLSLAHGGYRIQQRPLQ